VKTSLAPTRGVSCAKNTSFEHGEVFSANVLKPQTLREVNSTKKRFPFSARMEAGKEANPQHGLGRRPLEKWETKEFATRTQKRSHRGSLNKKGEKSLSWGQEKGGKGCKVLDSILGEGGGEGNKGGFARKKKMHLQDKYKKGDKKLPLAKGKRGGFLRGPAKVLEGCGKKDAHAAKREGGLFPLPGSAHPKKKTLTTQRKEKKKPPRRAREEGPTSAMCSGKN